MELTAVQVFAEHRDAGVHLDLLDSQDQEDLL